MRAFVSAFSCQKQGNSVIECEDAYAVRPEARQDELIGQGPIVVAVADGASESLLAKHWANHLAQSAVTEVVEAPSVVTGADEFAGMVMRTIDKWEAWLSAYPHARAEAGKPIQWYEQPGLDRGAFATILVAIFNGSASEEGRWCAAALGDTCMFQVRHDSLTCSFPLKRSCDFDNSPPLLGSKSRDVPVLVDHVSMMAGEFVSGDQFFLGTDALAAWFLGRVESGGTPWDELRDLTCQGDHDDFHHWVADERSNRNMRNADVTVIHVDFG